MALPKASDHKTKTFAFGGSNLRQIAKVLSSCALRPQKLNTNTKKGFTMIEILVVITLIAIIISLGMVMSMDSFRGFSFRNDRDAVVAALQRARSLAINNICLGSTCDDGKKHGVHFDPAAKEIVIFQGNSYNSSDVLNEAIKFESKAISAVSTIDDVVFDRLSGNAVNATITMTDGAGRSATIETNSAGRINY
jgi:prepilin-type N-terminal cleavage/methylation domain-containing protein